MKYSTKLFMAFAFSVWNQNEASPNYGYHSSEIYLGLFSGFAYISQFYW